MENKTITLITGNRKKLEEVKAILGNDFPLEIVNQQLDLPEFEGVDRGEMTILKCQMAARFLKRPVLIENTNLSLNDVDDLPESHIKWVLEKTKPEELHNVLSTWADKSVTIATTFVFSDGVCNHITVFKGTTKGTIVAPRGSTEFGWDRIFQPDGYDKTCAELTTEEKNKISHRYKALDTLKKYFIKRCSED